MVSLVPATAEKDGSGDRSVRDAVERDANKKRIMTCELIKTKTTDRGVDEKNFNAASIKLEIYVTTTARIKVNRVNF
jgi:hypothetical protein